MDIAEQPAQSRRIAFSSDIELILLFLVLLFMLFVGLAPENEQRVGIYVGSIALPAVLFYGAFLQVQKSKLMIWNLLVWFRAATAVFFGLGNFVPYLGNAATIANTRNIYDFSDTEATMVITLAALGSLIVLFVARFFSIRVKEGWTFSLTQLDGRRQIFISLLFLLLGGMARYGMVLPYYYGWVDYRLPGWMFALSAAYAAGLFALLLWALRHSKQMLFVPLSLIVVDVAMGALAFDKSEIVLTLLFAYLAVLYHRFTILRAVAGFVTVASIMFFAQSPAHYGRYFVNNYFDEKATLGERVEIIKQYLIEGDTITRFAGGDLNPFLRISYLAPASFVIGEYDEGRPGNMHDNALAAFVPRILWPNKPAIGGAGGEVYWLMTGRTGASVGVGHFAESYWSFGWLGPFIVFLPGGLILAIMAKISIYFVQQERWLMLPVVLFGIATGYKVSGTWVSGVLGSFATFLVLTVIFMIVEALVVKRRSSQV